jgi:predicted GTPase
MGQAQTINIPDYQLERLAQHLINVIPEYFKNPANQSRFEEWENQNNCEGRKKREVKQV